VKQERKIFFLGKKQQKTFTSQARSIRKGRSRDQQKFFASFFQKKIPPSSVRDQPGQ
jgi:hypothetical protein